MYDLIIIGAGPGGYIAAKEAAKAKLSVLLIDKGNIGGVCLNEGCVPTKTLLNAAKIYDLRNKSAQFGVIMDNTRIDFAAAMRWKNQVITDLRKGVEQLLRQLKVEIIAGEAVFNDRNSIKVNGQTYQGKNIIIATGSSPALPPIPGIQLPNVITSKELLELNELPESLAVIGGGVIGIEFASLFSALGVQVEVIEMLDEIIPIMDKDPAKVLRSSMKAVGFHLGAKVTQIIEDRQKTKDKKLLKIVYIQNNEEKTITAEFVLVAVGRKPNIKGLNLDEISMDTDSNGIRINEKMQTNLPGVYAIGDVTGKSLLAHSASRMGEAAINIIKGQKDHMRYTAIPWAVYSLMEAAGCGLTEAEAVRQGRKVKTAVHHLRSNTRFYAENGIKPGLCKVIADAETNVLLGVHLVGEKSSELIFAAAVMLETELRIKDLKEIVFPHPTIGEVIRDAVFDL